jgi:hypothetical protein
LEDPISFLYFHTVELALKAFVRSHGQQIRTGHKLTAWFEKCTKLGLTIEPQDKNVIENIVSLLESGNQNHGFRYFVPGSVVTAELEYAREGVNALMRTIAPQVEARSPIDEKPRVAKAILAMRINESK